MAGKARYTRIPQARSQSTPLHCLQAGRAVRTVIDSVADRLPHRCRSPPGTLSSSSDGRAPLSPPDGRAPLSLPDWRALLSLPHWRTLLSPPDGRSLVAALLPPGSLLVDVGRSRFIPRA